MQWGDETEQEETSKGDLMVWFQQFSPLRSSVTLTCGSCLEHIVFIMVNNRAGVYY